MDDKRVAVHPALRPKARRIAADGFIGRLTYTPAHVDGSIGQLRRNRTEDETPHFKQVTPFAQWCPPTRINSQPGDKGPSQAAWSQRHWLLEHRPEAAVADEGIESLLLEEIATHQAERPPAPTQRTPLFSVGEMADLRQADTPKGHPVLAVVSGISGNVLRLHSLAHEEWTWSESDIRVRLHVPDPKLRGDWCQDAVPISLVKFATDARKHDPIRWLVVSNGASTTVYEPELRMIPMPATGVWARAFGRSAASQIFANPLFTIPCGRTGPSLQADVCFIRHAEADVPQLAVIDKAGYWSLWDVTGRRSTFSTTLTPVLRMCGNSVSGSIPKLPATSVVDPQPHTIFWLSLKHESPIVETDPPQPPRRLLLLCSPRSLCLFEIDSQKLHSVAHLVLPKDTHRILGAAPSRLDPGQAFILTSTTLFWVAVAEGKKGQLTLDILVSGPHQKDVNDPTLRMDVSPGAYISGSKACFVCVRSIRDTEMTVFWFVNPGRNAPVRYHRDLVSLKGTSSFIGLHVLPAGRRVGNEPTSAAGRAMHKAGLRFFQLLTLGQDFAVHCALCAWSDEAGIFVPPPDGKEALGDDNSKQRRKLLQILTDAFAVPDEFDERVVFGKDGVGPLSLERLEGGKQQRVDFGLVAQRLAAEVGLEAGVGDRETSPAQGVDFGFIAEAIEREKAGGYMPRHSLLDLAIGHSGADIFELARAWDAQQDALHRSATEWSFVPEARRPLIDFGPDDLVEKLKDLFVEPAPSGSDPTRSRREAALQTMAAEMFLSNIGVSSVPQSWTTTENEAPSSLPFPSSPTLASSQPRLSSSHKGKEKAKEQPDEDRGDAAALRLRKYATLDTSPESHGEPVVALSRWDLGADPDDITWRPGQDIEAEEAINRRRRKIEARRRRAERLSQRIFGEDSLGMNQSSQSLGGLSSQPVPTILPTGRSSQGPRQSQSQSQSQTQPTVLPWDFSSQHAAGPYGTPRARAGSPLRREYRRDSSAGAPLFSSQLARPEQSQGTPSQHKSQVVPGLFGGRPSFSPFKRSPLKKGKRKSELRMSGFR